MTAKKMTKRTTGLSLLTALLATAAKRGGALAPEPSPELNRRSALKRTVASIYAGGFVATTTGGVDAMVIDPREEAAGTPMVAAAAASSQLRQQQQPRKPQQTFASAYQVVPDASPALNPQIKSVSEGKLIRCLGQKTGALWMGEHHNDEQDHALQVDVIRKLHASKRRRQALAGRKRGGELAVGLEQVQVQFQPVLDAYVAGKISLEEMRREVEWDQRWSWNFEGYRGVFELARQRRIPLIALNVDSEDMFRVVAGGFSNLSPEKRGKYILDPEGFASFAKPRCFKCYVEYCILPSFDMHEKLGLLQYTMAGEKLDEPMNFKRFFSGRILWDEAMASRAYRWTKENPHGLLVGLVGADHVKYGNGIPGRYDRMVGGTRDCVSVMLNPSLIDTRPSGSIATDENTYDPNRLTLQLIYDKEGVDPTTDARFQDENIGGSLPLADYILTSKAGYT